MLRLVTSRGPLTYSDSGGDLQRQALVLVHGIQGTAAAWDPVIPMLAARRRVVAVNLRGREGSTVRRPEDLTVPAFAEDLQSLVATLGTPVHLVGWSMGVLVVLQLLACNDAGVVSAVLASGTACVGEDARWFRASDAAGVAAEAADRAARLRLDRTAPPETVAASWLSVRTADLRGALGGVRVPALVIHGAHDDECPLAHAHALARHLPHARLSVWAGSGHNLVAADPRRFAGEVLAHADDCERATAP